MMWLSRLLAVALIGACPDAFAQVEIGASEWVSPTAWGTAPGLDRQELQPFAGIVEDERIETESRAAADFVFQNGSRVLVGPECQVVLDEAFYDPELDEVASMDIYADTVCVVHAGAGGETLSFETPVAVVTIKEASATVVYLGAQAEAGSTRTLHASGPRTPPRGLDLAVFFESGLQPGGDSFVEVRGTTGEVALLRRPGFMVIHATPGGLGTPEQSDPALLGRTMARLTGTGRPTAPLPIDLATAPSLSEVYTTIEGPAGPGVPFQPCAVSSFCDAETVILNPIYSTVLGSGLGVTFPFP